MIFRMTTKLTKMTKIVTTLFFLFILSNSATAQICDNPPAINIVNIGQVTCAGKCDGYLIVTGLNGVPPYSFNITPNANQAVAGSFDMMCAGIYTVTIADSRGCTATTPVTISSPPPNVIFSTVNIHHVYCNGDATGSIAVVVNGGSGNVQFSISPAATQFPTGFFKDLPSDTYTVTATDVNGCNANTVAIVTENQPLSFTSIALQNPVCSYDSTGVIAYTATGGTAPLLYSLNDGLPHELNSFTDLKSGVYKLKIIDKLGCSKDTLLQLTAAQPVTAQIITTDAFCVDSANGRAEIIGSGGYGAYRYFVTPGLNINKTGEFFNLTPDMYTLRVVDTLGCEYSTAFEVNQPADPLSASIAKTDLNCHGRGNEGKATANVWGGTPPYVYQWSTTPVQNAAVAENLYFGYYYVDITDAMGCRISDTTYIAEGPCCDIAFIPMHLHRMVITGMISLLFLPQQVLKWYKWKFMTAGGRKCMCQATGVAAGMVTLKEKKLQQLTISMFINISVLPMEKVTSKKAMCC